MDGWMDEGRERGDTLLIQFMLTFQLKGDCKFYEKMALRFFFKANLIKIMIYLKFSTKLKCLMWKLVMYIQENRTYSLQIYFSFQFGQY